MKQKIALMTTPILIVLVTLSIFTTPAAAPPPPVNEHIYAEGKAILWCKGKCYSGEADVQTNKETYIYFTSKLTEPLGFIGWEQLYNYKIFSMALVTSSTPQITSDMPELKFVIVLICGDSVTLYAFGWGCFLYFKGTVWLITT